MDVDSLCHVHILRPSSAEEVYLMSTGKAPASVILLTNHLLTNNSKAFKASISEEVIEEWNKDPSNAELSRGLFLDEVAKALVGLHSFTFEVTYKFKAPRSVALVNLMDTNNPKTILEVNLEEIQASQGLTALSRTASNSFKSSQASESSRSEMGALMKDNERLKKALEDLTVAKSRWEDSHYRAFASILNAKKRKICELQGVPFGRPKATKSRRGPHGSDSESSEVNTSDEGGNSSEDYDRDTDVDDPGFGHNSQRHLPVKVKGQLKGSKPGQGSSTVVVKVEDSESDSGVAPKSKSQVTPSKSPLLLDDDSGSDFDFGMSRGPSTKPPAKRGPLDSDSGSDFGMLRASTSKGPSKPPPKNGPLKVEPKGAAGSSRAGLKTPQKKGPLDLDSDTGSDFEMETSPSKRTKSSPAAKGPLKMGGARVAGNSKGPNSKTLQKRGPLDMDSDTGSDLEMETSPSKKTKSPQAAKGPLIRGGASKTPQKRGPLDLDSDTGSDFEMEEPPSKSSKAPPAAKGPLTSSKAPPPANGPLTRGGAKGPTAKTPQKKGPLDLDSDSGSDFEMKMKKAPNAKKAPNSNAKRSHFDESDEEVKVKVEQNVPSEPCTPKKAQVAEVNVKVEGSASKVQSDSSAPLSKTESKMKKLLCLDSDDTGSEDEISMGSARDETAQNGAKEPEIQIKVENPPPKSPASSETGDEFDF